MFPGVKTDLIIDTCNAGVGLLAVTMDGPSRVAMDCTDVDEGYKVRDSRPDKLMVMIIILILVVFYLKF